MTNPNQLANAWDILYLANIGFGQSTAPCTRTVTFKGACYYGGAVNYAMWGRVNLLCWMQFGWFPVAGGQWSLPSAITFATIWKLAQYKRLGPEETQAIAFTVYGYTGYLPSRRGIPSCTPAISPVRKYAFQWRWLPVRNPDGAPTR